MADPSQTASQTIATEQTRRDIVITTTGKPPYGSQKDSNYTGGYKILY